MGYLGAWGWLKLGDLNLEHHMSILYYYVGHTQRSKEAMFKNSIIKLVQCSLSCGADMT